jgi:hypothetical protein
MLDTDITIREIGFEHIFGLASAAAAAAAYPTAHHLHPTFAQHHKSDTTQPDWRI